MRSWLCALLVSVLFAPRAAHAWTDAHVREARATLALDVAQQRVGVTLDLAVEVRGGWLERLDLTGLDEELTPEPTDAAYAVLEGGERVSGKLSVRGALASVRFQRRDGLRRGMHHVVLRYSAPLAEVEVREGAAQRLAWTLPGWEAGLLRGVIEVEGAGALRPVVDADVAQDVEEAHGERGPVLRFTRVHVPRASPWTVALEVAPAARAAGLASAGGARGEAAGPRLRTGAALAVALFLLAMLRRVLRGRRDGRAWLAPPAAAALAALGALCWAYAVPLALLCWIALGWGTQWRRATSARPLPFGRVMALRGLDLARLRGSRWWGWIGTPCGEAVSLCGLLELVAVIAFAVAYEARLTAADPWGLGVLCVPFGAVAGSRWWSARDSAEQLRLLLRAAARARVVACGLSLSAYLAGGKAYYPRLRLWPSVRYPGLLRVEVLVHARRAVSPLWLSVEVEPESAAARWLLALWPDVRVERSAQSQRLALRRPIEDVGAAAEQLLEHLSRESQSCLAERAPAQAA